MEFFINLSNPWDERSTKEFLDSFNITFDCEESSMKNMMIRYLDDENFLHFLMYAVSVESDLVRLKVISRCLKIVTQDKYHTSELMCKAENQKLLESNSFLLLLYVCKIGMMASEDQSSTVSSIRDSILEHLEYVILDSVGKHSQDSLILKQIRAAFNECDSKASSYFLMVLQEKFQWFSQFLNNLLLQEGYEHGDDFPLTDDGDFYLDSSYDENLMTEIRIGFTKISALNPEILPTLFDLLEKSLNAEDSEYGMALFLAHIFPMFLEDSRYSDRIVRMLQIQVLPLLDDESCPKFLKFRLIWCICKFSRQYHLPKELAFPAFKALFSRILKKIPLNEIMIIPHGLEAILKDVEVRRMFELDELEEILFNACHSCFYELQNVLMTLFIDIEPESFEIVLKNILNRALSLHISPSSHSKFFTHIGRFLKQVSLNRPALSLVIAKEFDKSGLEIMSEGDSC